MRVKDCCYGYIDSELRGVEIVTLRGIIAALLGMQIYPKLPTWVAFSAQLFTAYVTLGNDLIFPYLSFLIFKVGEECACVRELS